MGSMLLNNMNSLGQISSSDPKNMGQKQFAAHFLGMQMAGVSKDQLEKLELHQQVEIGNHPTSP
jgi:hypothetical protein